MITCGNNKTSTDRDDCTAQRIVLTGRVQGLGIRPQVYRLATALGLAGTVSNSSRGVEIHVEGSSERLARFLQSIPDHLPVGVELERSDAERTGCDQFAIVCEPDGGPLAAQIPPDLATCENCLRETVDLKDRRYRYPLTSCTECGPRYSIIRSMPYERPDTTMARFGFCERCAEEYGQPGNRRFHAQTNACPACGPRLWCVDRNGRTHALHDQALRAATRAVLSGKIVALRGVGGYQLLVDATNDDAVRRLRTRKRRRSKPLAVMVESPAIAERLAWLDETERAALTNRSNPIVLVRARQSAPGVSETRHACPLADAVHPQLDTIGLMLPTTPLHALLARDVGGPLVCTSGNVEGEPLEHDPEEARRSLAGLCDLWLDHDRPIERPVDDSVVRVIAGRCVTIRLARGLAPLPLDLPNLPPTLALGGYLKSAAAWSNGAQAVLGPHVGDQESLAARHRYLEHILESQTIYRFAPQRLIHDLHPAYYTSQWAAAQPIESRAVQHHHAHVAAGMLEHGWLDRQVLGVAWDGTGYGTDRTVWGGEFLTATARSFRRLACLRPFRLPGGERAIYEPWRTALALIRDAVGKQDADRWLPPGIEAARARMVEQIVEHPRFSPATTSAGRLFDAAAAVVLSVVHAEYDGQPAMMLEAIADRDEAGRYDLPVRAGRPLQLDWRPLVRQLLADCAADVPPGTIAMRFHRGLARGIVEVCRRRPDLPVVLSGGVFQNRLLTELVREMIPDRQLLGLPGLVPPNDGGLAAGQLAIASGGS